MSTVSSTTQTTPGAQSASNSASSRTQLGKDDFLKLLTTQLTHQDPMNPVDDKEFIAQMAQFTSVEQLTNMAQALDSLSLSSRLSGAASMVGRTVAWTDDSTGDTGSGAVTGVKVTDGNVTLTIGGKDVAAAWVRSVS